MTFDVGQTLAELDHSMLARRLAKRGHELDPQRLADNTPDAWNEYGRAKQRGLVGRAAWCTFMATLLARSGLDDPRAVTALAEWLYSEQPQRNLWRKPIAGMFELARELAAAGVPVGVVSNSEGRIAELLAELGQHESFMVIADSGVLGIEKPDPRIFEWTAERLGVKTTEIVHVGDSWQADVTGVLTAGGRAIWFAPTEQRELAPGVHCARTANEVRALLSELGVSDRRGPLRGRML